MRSISITILFWGMMAMLNLTSCNEESTHQDSSNSESKPKLITPQFSSAQAYEYVKAQLAFGPRVPGSEAQQKCAEWMQSELKKYADTVYWQESEVAQPVSNKKYKSINIIASFNPQAEYRVLLLAHWDSRPWADQDSNRKNEAIDAADDGASGVAVLMEIASHLKKTKPYVGVDILLVDVEDVGKTEWGEESYCLGTKYWAANNHVPNYKAMFGICLDMVGAKGAQFPLEGFSRQYASTVQKEIWDAGNRLGFSNYFVYTEGGSITDDHVVINTVKGMPCVDIINLQPDQGFGKHWHTHKDNIDIIDKNTLQAVGQTVMEVIYTQQ